MFVTFDSGYIIKEPGMKRKLVGQAIVLAMLWLCPRGSL
jgi:hypothetical protein